MCECVAQLTSVAGKENGEISKRRTLRFDHLAIGQRQNDRVAYSKHFIQSLLQTRGQPTLAEIVVNDKGAVWLEMTPHVFERLARKQKALETNVAVAAVEDQRIHQR